MKQFKKGDKVNLGLLNEDGYGFYQVASYVGTSETRRGLHIVEYGEHGGPPRYVKDVEIWPPRVATFDIQFTYPSGDVKGIPYSYLQSKGDIVRVGDIVVLETQKALGLVVERSFAKVVKVSSNSQSATKHFTGVNLTNVTRLGGDR